MSAFLYWLGFLIYCIAVVYIGWYGFRRQRHVADEDLDFWAAGRSLDALSVGFSISASFMSISWSCVYASQLYYWYGVSAIWLVPIPWLLTMLGFYFLAPLFRRLPAFSQPEMVASRFGSGMRPLLAVPLAFVFLVWGGAELYAAAKVLSPLLQAPLTVTLALIAWVVAVYSFLGGFAAVVVTDRLQFGLVAFFIVSLAAIALYALRASTGSIVPFSHLPTPARSPSALNWLAVSPALVFMTFVAYLPGWLVETDIWLRVQAARDLRAARRGILIALASSVVFLTLLPMIIGLAALVLYPPENGTIPARLEEGAAIFAVLMQDYTPLTLGVVLSIGLAAAAMSTIDTCSNVMALSLSYDVLEPWLRRRRPGLRTARIARLASAGAVLLAFVYALFTESLWDIFYLSSGVLTTTVFIPMVAIFNRRATASQVRASAITGFLCCIGFYTLESRGLLAFVQPDWLAATGLGYILWSFLLAWLAYLAAGWFGQKGNRSR